MAQDKRDDQPPSTRGRSPVSAAPETPDTRAINAEPLPEAPETGEKTGNESPDQPPPQDDENGKIAVPEEGESESARLRREIDEARKTLETKEAELERVEAKERDDAAANKMVEDYSTEVPALQAAESNLKQYQTAETSFLNEVLPEAARAAIAEVDKGPKKEIADLRARIEKKEQESAEARQALDEARKTATQKKRRAEALKRPAASIRDRIKRAEAVRAEATKASDAGRYALAYWLVMPCGRLEKAIKAEPEIIKPGVLKEEIKTAAADQKKAEDSVATLTKEVETIDAALQQDRTRLAELQASLDARILAELSELNPQTAAAA